MDTVTALVATITSTWGMIAYFVGDFETSVIMFLVANLITLSFIARKVKTWK